MSTLPHHLSSETLQILTNFSFSGAEAPLPAPTPEPYQEHTNEGLRPKSNHITSLPKALPQPPCPAVVLIYWTPPWHSRLSLPQSLTSLMLCICQAHSLQPRDFSVLSTHNSLLLLQDTCHSGDEANPSHPLLQPQSPLQTRQQNAQLFIRQHFLCPTTRSSS